MRPAALLFAALIPALVSAQAPIAIHVDGAAGLGPFRPVFSYFGYDEPNYTYMRYGPKLVGELAASEPVTGIYPHAPPALHRRRRRRLSNGVRPTPIPKMPPATPVYDWTIVDRIFDTYMQAGAKPFVEIGFMPEALSIHPRPYTRNWPSAR